MTEHEVGHCDICNEKIRGYGLHGLFGGVNKITRLCNKCYEKM